MTNGSSFDKNLTTSDAEPLKDKEQEAAAKSDVKDAKDTKDVKEVKEVKDVKETKVTMRPAITRTTSRMALAADAKPAAAKKDIKSARGVTEVKKKPGVTSSMVSRRTTATATATASTKTPRTEAPKLSIDTKRAQVKAMLEAEATPKGELEVVTEEMPPAEASKPETLVSSPQML